ncbi:MAG TPA: hypothetical protein VGC65_09860 [Bacteroidia bacterium]|jgi:hypothetical protein
MILKKITLLLICYLAIAKNCNAKDSTLVLRVGIGMSYNKISLVRYNTTIAPPGSGPLFYYKTFTSQKSTEISPVLKLGIQKKIYRFFDLNLNVSYSYNKSSYSYYEGNSHYVGPSYNFVLVVDSAITRDYTVYDHNFNLSLTGAFSFKAFYIAPKINFLDIMHINKMKETYQKNEITNTISTTKTHNLLAGGGLTIGMNFKINKLPFFIEIQSDYYSQSKLDYRSNLYGSLFLGFCF